MPIVLAPVPDVAIGVDVTGADITTMGRCYWNSWSRCHWNRHLEVDVTGTDTTIMGVDVIGTDTTIVGVNVTGGVEAAGMKLADEVIL